MGVYEPPCSNVQSGINVGIRNIATVCTAKVLTAAKTYMQAFVTGLRSICRRYSDNFYACPLAFVLKERAKLAETPRVASPSKRLVAFLGVHTLADILQIFYGYALMFLFRLCNKPFAYSMVHNGSKSSFTSFQPFQQLMAVTSAFGLNRRPNSVVFVSYIFGFVRRYIRSVRERNYIGNTHINTNKVLNALLVFVRNVYRLVKKELAFHKDKVGFTSRILHKFGTIANVWYLCPTINKRYGADRLINVIGKHPAVISDSSELPKMPLRFPIKFVRINSLTYRTYNKLRRKVICAFDRIVNFLMQLKLIEYTTLPRYTGDSITSLVENTKCFLKRFNLLCFRQKFYRQCQFHATMIQNSFETIKHLMLNFINKEGRVVQFLPEAKDFGVSLNFFL